MSLTMDRRYSDDLVANEFALGPPQARARSPPSHTSTPNGDSPGPANEGGDDAALSFEVQLLAGDSAKLIGHPEVRRQAAQSYFESVGGTLHGFWYAFGEHDG